MTRKTLLLIFVITLGACSGGGGGGTTTTNNTNTTNNVTPALSNQEGELKTIGADGADCAASGSTVTISGTISYERVPFSSTLGGGLDYNNIQTLPVRGAEIEALASSGCIMSSSTTSDSGTYSLAVNQNTDTVIRIKAKTQSTSGAIWDFEVRDNTNSNRLYVLDGASLNSGTTDTTRNILASSGWTGSSYGDPRSAGPFAILDSVYKATQAVVAIDSSIVMDDADIFWSVNNSSATGLLSNGEISTSFYSNDRIYILGKADSDSDEYDEHVVIHEWGHYFEDNLSRSDSVGGSHGITSKLDMRVALGEGFGNALSGMITGDPVYRDSGGTSQASDFQINVESNASINRGWFNEGSVQTVLYDIFDSDADSNDAVNLGLAAIYNAMVSSAYKNQSTLTSIFSLVSTIKSQNPSAVTEIDNLLSSQLIEVQDSYGTGETNSGGDANDLPVYKSISDDANPVTICSHRVNGEQNRLGNRQFLRLNVVSGGSHTITATRVSGLSSSDPDIKLLLNGALLALSESDTNNVEVMNVTLAVDEYIIEVYHYYNVDSASGGGTVCFNVTVF